MTNPALIAKLKGEDREWCGLGGPDRLESGQVCWQSEDKE